MQIRMQVGTVVIGWGVLPDNTPVAPQREEKARFAVIDGDRRDEPLAHDRLARLRSA